MHDALESDAPPAPRDYALCPRCINSHRRRAVFHIAYPEAWRASCGSCLTPSERRGIDEGRRLALEAACAGELVGEGEAI